MNLTEACIRKPVFAWMLMAATVVFGGVAATRIGISQLPDVDFPTLSISVTWEGATPEAIEHDVIEPLEEAVVQIEGVRSISSRSQLGSGRITLELDLSRDIDVALQDVQARIAQAQRSLPRDIDPPIVAKSNPEDQPILWLAIAGPYSKQFLSDFARYRLKEKLQTVPGVGEITMGGFLERNIRVWLDAERLDEKDLTVTEVIAALRREHVEVPAGQLDAVGREVNVRVLGEALEIAELRRIVVRSGQGGPVYLEDVALVEDGFEDERRMARVDGAPAIGLGVRKQRGANVVAVARGVKAALVELRKAAPEGLDIGINNDASIHIEESVAEIRFALLLAVGLTALVCWMFLGSISSTLNVVLAIPMSLLGTIATIYFLGYTLNTFTLLALSLAVGIVVDDAIMVLENITRHMEEGKERVRAAREGTAEIAFAALSATAAIIAIFIPVVFMKGVVGKFFLQFGVTLCVAVLLSYVEAMTLAPARASQLVTTGRAGRTWLGRGVDRSFDLLARGYRAVLRPALAAPLLVVIVVFGAVIGGAWTVGRRLPREFVPAQDQSRILVRLQTAVGSDLGEADAIFRKVEERVRSHPEVTRLFTIIGGFGGTGVNTGVMFVSLVPPERRRYTQADFMGVLRRELNAIPGVRAVPQDLSQAGFTAQRGFPVEFSVRGPDWDRLIELSGELRERLAAGGVVVDLDSDYQIGMPELRITPDRARAADVGVSVDEVATTLSTLVGGVRVGKYSTGGRRIDVRLRLLAAQRSRPEDLARLRVRTGGGDVVPLSALVRQEERPALQAINRADRERAISIYGNVAPGRSQDEALATVEQLGRDLPPGYHVVLGGGSKAFRESFGDLGLAFLLGIIVAYMVLASQFNSFLHPITVLTILLPAAAGGVFGLWVAGKSLSIFSVIGLLLLMGIVKKNSIILVDYAVRLRREGVDARSAMLRAGPVRLRPIVMTTISTLVAALPAAVALGPGAETRAPMAIAVIGGLIVSTVLSLLAVPAFYVLADGVDGGVRRVVGRLRGGKAPGTSDPLAASGASEANAGPRRAEDEP